VLSGWHTVLKPAGTTDDPAGHVPSVFLGTGICFGAGVGLGALSDTHLEPLGAFDPVFPPNPTSDDPAGHVPSGFLDTSPPTGVVEVLLQSEPAEKIVQRVIGSESGGGVVVGPPGNVAVDGEVPEPTHAPTFVSRVPVGHFPSSPLGKVCGPSVDGGQPVCPVGVIGSFLSKSVSKYGRSNDAGGVSSIVPIIVCGLQNGALGEVVQISFLTAPVSAGMELDDVSGGVVLEVMGVLQRGSLGFVLQGSV